MVKRIKIVGTGDGNRTIFAGFDLLGRSVYGKSGDKFNVPEDISRDSATKLLISGFAEPV